MKKIQKSEERIQQEAFIEIWNKYPAYRGLLFHIPNEGKRSLRQGAIQKSIGLIKGMPDLCFALPINGKGMLFIEVKKLGEKPRKEQVIQIQKLIDAGNTVEICYSPEGIINKVEDWIKKYIDFDKFRLLDSI